MRLRPFLTGIGQYAFTEILCLFIALTLSPFSGTLAKLISCICTIIIMICLCINYGAKRANEDRISHIENTVSRKAFLSASITLVFVILGLGLILARAGVLPDNYYRWYKLIDAPFLQLCNFVSSDIAASSLSWGQTLGLAACNLAPFLTTWITYELTRRGVSLEEIQYRK